MDDEKLLGYGSVWNAAAIALVIFMAGMLYAFGQAMSGSPQFSVSLSQTVAWSDGDRTGLASTMR